MNLYKSFLELIPRSALLVGEVTTHNADGTSTVELPDSAVMRARGQSVTIGNKAFIEAGEIRGEAPNLPSYDLEV